MTIFSMWKNIRMVTLVAVTAALYAAILIPFKAFTIIPGFTEVRPANAIPIVCSLLFGPAAAWGAAIGNLVGDFFGTLTLGSIFGFIGNFFYGWVPFLVWRVVVGKDAQLRGPRQVLAFIIGTLASSLICAAIIAPGVQAIGGPPIKVLGPAIFANNAVVGLTLGAVLLLALSPAVRAMGLTYDQIVEGSTLRTRDLD